MAVERSDQYCANYTDEDASCVGFIFKFAGAGP